MKQADVEAWFGDRGCPLLSARNMKYKVVTRDGERWCFMPQRYQTCSGSDFNNEVELYYMETMFCEVYDGWPEKGFDWSSHNLSLLLPQENDT